MKSPLNNKGAFRTAMFRTPLNHKLLQAFISYDYFLRFFMREWKQCRAMNCMNGSVVLYLHMHEKCLLRYAVCLVQE